MIKKPRRKTKKKPTYLKRSRINPVSKKQSRIKRKEVILKKKMVADAVEAGMVFDWRGPQKHEPKKRSHGADPTNEAECVILNARDHNQEHGIKEVDSKPEFRWMK